MGSNDATAKPGRCLEVAPPDMADVRCVPLNHEKDADATTSSGHWLSPGAAGSDMVASKKRVSLVLSEALDSARTRRAPTRFWLAMKHMEPDRRNMVFGEQKTFS